MKNNKKENCKAKQSKQKPKIRKNNPGIMTSFVYVGDYSHMDSIVLEDRKRAVFSRSGVIGNCEQFNMYAGNLIQVF